MGPRYFSTVGARLIAGREFDGRDDRAAPKVMIVNEQFARFYYAGGNPMGRTVYLQEEPKKPKVARQIVGVVKDMRISWDIRVDPPRYYYVPAFQANEVAWSMRFLIRTIGDPHALFPALRAAVRAEDPALPIDAVDTAAGLLGRALSRDRLIAALSAAFGLLALSLAAIGIYGLLSYEVARRTGEMGIRMALGATRAAIVRLILSEIAGVAAIGVAIGGAAALAAGKLVAGLVFGLRPNDPAVLAAAAIVLIGVALSAGFWPSRRAARLDPMAALRME